MRRENGCGCDGQTSRCGSGHAVERVLRALPQSVASPLTLLATLVLCLMLQAIPASASEGSCPNEARRLEQGSTSLPDCRAYELVSQPYQPAPKVTPFEASEGVPRTITPEFFSYPGYSPEPLVLPAVQEDAFTASDGHAVAYNGEEPNTESTTTESPVNVSKRAEEVGWTGENILPPESAKSGYGCKGSTVVGLAPSLDQIAVQLGGGGGGGGQDYQHCDHDEPYLFSEAEGESRETANLMLRSTAARSWSLLSIYPLEVTTYDPGAAGSQEYSQYTPIFDAVSSDGTTGVFASQAQLTTDAPNGETVRLGAEVDGHCQNEFGNIYVWSAGTDRILTVPPDGIPVRGTLAGAHPGSSLRSGCERQPQQTAGFTDPVSANGERILFYANGGFQIDPGTSSTAPRAPYIDGGLYLREHPGAEQSALAHGGAAGTGTLTAGSDAVASLRVTLAAGVGSIEVGSHEVTRLATLAGKFAAGQAIEGQGLPAGTTITEITERTRTLGNGATETYPVLVLSSAATESVESDKLTAVSEGAAPFAVGQMITGRGLPAGTTITAVARGSLTLSNKALASAGRAGLESSSGCTEAQKACTLQIDAPEEGATGAPGGGQFQWANAETTKIFFTDDERLTADATAQADEPDLYEYDLEKPVGRRLTDLTVNASAPADVLGLAGVSEDGSYVYFVAQGDLTGSQQNSHGASAVGSSATGEGTVEGPAQGTGTLTEGSDVVSGLSVTSGEFHVGQAVMGPLPNNYSESPSILPATKITACAPSCSSPSQLTLSSVATSSVSGAAITGLGDYTVTHLTTSAGAFAPGMAISGPGIPAHTSIFSVGNGTLTLSERPTTSGPVALSATAPPSLYVRHAGTTTFIASLNAEGGDQCDWTAWCLTSRVSRNGRYIAFDSIDSLTGYDNMPVKPTACNFLTSEARPLGGQPGSFDEVPCMMAYRYAAQAGAHGELTCATCNPDGRPLSGEFPWALVRQAYREGPSLYGDQITLDHPMADTGQVFFETQEQLVGADENSKQGGTHNSVDVYEYSGGEGSSAQYHLISTGKSGAASEFLDASSDGSNVFFATAEPLVAADTRRGEDIYDARVDGGLRAQSEALQPQPCTSVEGCHSPPAEAPGEFSAGSSALSGSGNLTPAPEKTQAKQPGKAAKCRKGFVRRSGRCVKKHAKRRQRKRAGRHRHHRAAHSHRRAGK